MNSNLPGFLRSPDRFNPSMNPVANGNTIAKNKNEMKKH
jgi:hypothetical protein